MKYNRGNYAFNGLGQLVRVTAINSFSQYEVELCDSSKMRERWVGELTPVAAKADLLNRLGFKSCITPGCFYNHSHGVSLCITADGLRMETGTVSNPGSCFSIPKLPDLLAIHTIQNAFTLLTGDLLLMQDESSEG